MKQQTTKKLFAFIITIMMISVIPESANSQPGKDKKPPKTYTCYCAARGWGCTTSACTYYCAFYCGTWINAPIKETSLKSIYNPDSQSATISFFLPQSAKLTLKIFNVNGILLKILADDVFDEGDHSIEWSTAEVNEGVYVVQLQSSIFTQTEKLIVMK